MVNWLAILSNYTPPPTDATRPPAALTRLRPQDRGALMTLCGGRRGGCLTTDEMKTLERVTGDMAGAYTSIEALFDTLGRQMRVSCDVVRFTGGSTLDTRFLLFFRRLD